jgi:hypothetical protein
VLKSPVRCRPDRAFLCLRFCDGRTGLIAGKPAPTGFVVCWRFWFQRILGVTALASSLASQLPQVLWCVGDFGSSAYWGDCSGLIAGKPAPTGFVVCWRFWFQRILGVAALASSLASQLPQVLWCVGNFGFSAYWRWLLWPNRWQASSHRFCGVLEILVPAHIGGGCSGLIAGKPAPTEFVVCRKFQLRRISLWELACQR